MSHEGVKPFENFIQGLIKTFDDEGAKKEKITSPLEEPCDNDVTLMEE